MRPHGLVDTGALLALLDRRDPWHEACVMVFSSIRLPLATTAAILAELFRFLVENPDALSKAWQLLRSDAITVMPISDDDLSVIEDLMVKYSDRPMDFADATLVRLAQRESLSTIFTVDHNDFETYRIRGKSRFRIVPSRQAKLQ